MFSKKAANVVSFGIFIYAFARINSISAKDALETNDHAKKLP
jgi:hypothetical protein